MRQIPLPGGSESEPALPGDRATPLADRVRPRRLEEIVGQDAALGPGTPLRRALESGRPTSLILWGPPGSGKTTLGRLIASLTRSPFVAYSAVLAGMREIRDVVGRAETTRARGGPSTILLVDEVHRFNRAQQDAFLPHVENGTITLVGATTENPSFEVNAALLSRCRVITLRPLGADDLEAILRRALRQDEMLRETGVRVDDDALRRIAAASRGDARRALGVLEAAVVAATPGDGSGVVDLAAADAALAESPLLYDRSGDEHFNLLSALHKSLRNSDADAAIYWLVRMLRSGEAPRSVARRLVRFASEDVGLADPAALTVATAALQAFEFLGLPEGALALVEAAVYLAAAPKSNALALAHDRVMADLDAGRSGPVPLHLRNAPTALMSALGHGAGYRYAHDEDAKVAAMICLPEGLEGRLYYQPTDEGKEREIARALAEWARRREHGR
jgi:putative ATPase